MTNKVVDLSSGRVSETNITDVIRRHHEGIGDVALKSRRIPATIVAHLLAHPERVSEATRIEECEPQPMRSISASPDRRESSKSGHFRVALLIGNHAHRMVPHGRVSPVTTSYATPATISSSSAHRKGAEAHADAFFEKLPSATTQMPCSYPLSASADE